MAGLSSLVTLGGRLKIWTLRTICKYVFLAFLDDLAMALPLTITLISQVGLWAFPWLVDWARGLLVGFPHS